MAPKTLNDLAPLALADVAEYRRQRAQYFPDSLIAPVSRAPEPMVPIEILFGVSCPPPAPVRMRAPTGQVAVVVPEDVSKAAYLGAHMEPIHSVRPTWRGRAYRYLTLLDAAVYAVARSFLGEGHMTDTAGFKAPMKGADKVVGFLLLAAIAGAGAWAMMWLLPILIELAKNTLIFGVELVALVIFALVVFDKDTWTAVYFKWKNVSRNIRKAIVREDPIGVLNTIINRFDKKLAEIDNAMTVADGAKKRQEASINTARTKSGGEDRLATAAERMNKPKTEVAQHATAALRWSRAADDMVPQAEMLQRMFEGMVRARDLCASRLEDAKNQKDVMQARLEALLSAQRGVKLFKRFFGNNPDLEMQDLALEEVERQSTEAEAEIDQFMRVITPSLQAADLRREADTMEAMDRLNTYITTGKPAVAALPAAPVAEAIVVTKDTRVKERA